MDASTILEMQRMQQGAAQAIAAQNNAMSERQAAKQMDFQYKMFKEANAMNINEAEKSRIWQQALSDTAHQREVKDLQAAGLNPILSSNHGASTPTGATADSVAAPIGAKGEIDESVNMSVASMFDAAIGYLKEMDALNVSAKMNERIAQMQADTQKAVAGMSADAVRYSSNQSSNASKYGSDTQRQIALINANSAKELKQLDYDLSLRNQDYISKNYPSNLYQAMGSQDVYKGADIVRNKISDLISGIKNSLTSSPSAKPKSSSKGYTGNSGKF